MRIRSLACFVCLAVFAVASPAWSAPIEITARLNPGQSGPIYGWSLLLSVEAGYAVGAVDLLTSGFDSFEINLANLGISVPDSVYSIDPLGDGRNVLILNNPTNGIAFSETPATDVLLGTFYSTFRTSPPVLLWDCEFECGGTVFDPYLRARPPEDVALSAFPRALIALAVVPEPSGGVLVALGLCSLLASRARASESR